MENKEIKDYKEERFEFTLFVNDNIICKRNFKIYNFIENSMSTLEFKETVDSIVKLIDDDLKSKSRVFTWYYFNPAEPEAFNDYAGPKIEPWACTFKLVISDNKRDVITRIWDGYGYPKPIREKVDLSNKNVKVTTRDGQTYTYEKDNFFKVNEGRLSFEQEVLKSMLSGKQDVLLQITKKICEACSPSRDKIKEKGYFDPKENAKYLSNYTVFDNYGDKKYSYSLYLANKKIEKEWEKAVMNKTKNYFKTIF